MEGWKKSSLLPLPDTAISDIRAMYNLEKPGRIEEAIDILQDWLKKQDHIMNKEYYSKSYLEVTLITCKGSIEKAKKQIDRLATIKTMLPKFFSETNAKGEFFYQYYNDVMIVPLPKVTSDLYRVLVIKYNNQDFSSNRFSVYYKFLMILSAYIKAHDYVNGFVAIVDMRAISLMNLVTAIDLIETQQLLMILTEGYGSRIKHIYFLTESKGIGILMTACKQFLSEKLVGRIRHLHEPGELKNFIPEEILPSEFGGTEKSLGILWYEWIEELSTPEHQKYMEMTKAARTDENLRTSFKFNEDYLGMPGTFRQLKVD